jgi:hypothetical protein
LSELRLRCWDSLVRAVVTAALTTPVTGTLLFAGFGSASAGATDSVPALRGASISHSASLGPGQYIQSTNGLYIAIMQADGNFVVYGPSGALWSTGTWGTAAAALTLQNDGNVVLWGPNGQAFWSAGTWGTTGNTLTIQNDGDLVLTGAPTDLGTRPGQVLWSSQAGIRDSLSYGQAIYTGDLLISPNGLFRAFMQVDGNFVVYGPGGPLWWTGTVQRPIPPGEVADVLSMQVDGNVVLYQSGGVYNEGSTTPVWASNTSGTPGSYFVLQADGNLVLYGPSGAIWSSLYG